MKEFKKYFLIRAPPEEVYAALTNPLSIRLWTGEPAEMSTLPGSEFSLWGGSISGINLEFEPDFKLVQQWDFGDQEEPSIVTIKLHPHKHGTSMEVVHTCIPDEAFDDISGGWIHSYAASLEEFFN